ncbi:uncharacterized protein LOC128554343 [Mercenaria mercenaria]|uniref:uncharacterized protein LOC128554343 n=1 Tax=Mercenaria mercenaria TaxID=6596 RepID=UPI00234F8D13|nr:uncharacterized protein LOC128554343 [Mercenaria mercenaria]
MACNDIIKLFILIDEGSEVDRSASCQFKHLPGTFNVELSVQQHTDDKIFILLEKVKTEQKPPKLTELCTQATSKCGISLPITTTYRKSFCEKCKQLSWLSKDIGTTTAQDDYTFSTTKIKATDEGLQVSDIVIASISSFLGGVLCTLFKLFVYRFICQRKNEHDSTESNTKVTAKVERKPEISQITYETLTSTECVIADNAKTDHVYLNIDSNSKSNESSDLRNAGRSALLVNSVGTSEHLGCEQTNEVKDDHFYNVLKGQKAERVYERIKVKDEHTYTGLIGREPEDRRVKQRSSGEVSEYNNNRSSEKHNYFILQAEGSGNAGDETRKSTDQDHKSHMSETTGEEPYSNDHAYFTLQKVEQSNCRTAEIEQRDEDPENENNTDGHAYHILERV